MRLLLSVLNVAAGSIAGSCWLPATELIKFKLVNITACTVRLPSIVQSAGLRRVAGVPSRRRLRSCFTGTLMAGPTQLVTVGDRVLTVAASKIWNKIPGDITAVQLLTACRQQLKTASLVSRYALTSVLCLALSQLPYV
jgi:hypothetical protein